jgi:hypothetical protein
MRCRACNVNLTDFESTRRGASSGDFLDLCNSCLVVIRDDLETRENFGLYDPTQDDLDTDLYSESSAEERGPDADEGGGDLVTNDDEPLF